MKVKQKRRFFSFLINKPPQRQFVLMQFVLLTTIMLFILYGAFSMYQEVVTAAEGLNASGGDIRAQLQKLYAELFFKLIILFTVGFAVNIFFGLIFLNRITGPLAHVRRVLDKLADGKLPERSIRFRRHDLTPELADSMNRLVNHVKRHDLAREER